jgi:hypothetical protein
MPGRNAASPDLVHGRCHRSENATGSILCTAKLSSLFEGLLAPRQTLSSSAMEAASCELNESAQVKLAFAVAEGIEIDSHAFGH